MSKPHRHVSPTFGRNWLVLRAATAGLATLGVLAGLIVNIDRAGRERQDLALVLANYFSFFTILTALCTAVSLTVAVVWWARHPDAPTESRGIAIALLTVTSAVILVGVVYNVLLRGVPSAIAETDPPMISLLDRFTIEALHVGLPMLLIIDLVFAPRRRVVGWWALAILTGYPVLWTAYTMVRGGLVPDPDGSKSYWYPYPFLDPNGAGGWPSVWAHIGAITVGFLVMGVALIATTRVRAGR
ncbi:MAG TPA: Pr6Pr family membrane protein [Candidatus Lumbricidophila sp.]|nr:Pr6Pr family membrane protein [Candidatus Lumbricidophila sp.]